MNSGPSSIEGFDGFVLAELRVTKPSTKVYRSDYKAKKKFSFRQLESALHTQFYSA